MEPRKPNARIGVVNRRTARRDASIDNAAARTKLIDRRSAGPAPVPQRLAVRRRGLAGSHARRTAHKSSDTPTKRSCRNAAWSGEENTGRRGAKNRITWKKARLTEQNNRRTLGYMDRPDESVRCLPENMTRRLEESGGPSRR